MVILKRSWIFVHTYYWLLMNPAHVPTSGVLFFKAYKQRFFDNHTNTHAGVQKWQDGAGISPQTILRVFFNI